MTDAALARFHDAQCEEHALTSAPGPVVLYACGQHQLTALDHFETARGDRHYVQYEVTFSGVNELGDPIRLDEHVTIGPGTPVGADAEARQAILEDTSS
jgi:hypothetical protein